MLAHVAINFDDLPNNTVVGSRYPRASFSSNGTVVTKAENAGTSLPNVIVAQFFAGDSTSELYVTFDAPVNNLKFSATEIDAAKGVNVADIKVYENGVISSTKQHIVGNGSNSTKPEIIDLSQYQNVTRIDVVNDTDLNGLAFDDFSFDDTRTLINFDDLPDNTELTNQYPEATFSGSGTGVYVAAKSSEATSPPNVIQSTTTGDPNANLYVDFTVPVDNLTFAITGIDTFAGHFANVNIYENGKLFDTEQVDAKAEGDSKQIIDLSKYQNVTRIEVVNDTDPLGLGFDDFGFEQVSTSNTLPDIDAISVQAVSPTEADFTYSITGNPGNVTFGLYRSATATFDAAADTLLATQVINTAADATAQGKFVLTTPDNDSSRPYLLVVADPDNTVAESDETNNVASVLLPDIQMVGAQFTTDSSVDFTYSVSGDPGSVLFGLYRSKTEQFDPNTAVPLAGQFIDVTANASGTGNFQLSGPLPYDADYPYVLAVADPANAIVESDESNNVVTAKIPLPDIQMVAAQFTSDSTVNFAYSVSGNPGSVLFGLYRSPTAQYDPNTAVPLDGESINVTANASGIGTFVLSGPLPDDADYPYVLVFADPNNTITESNETNNVVSTLIPQSTGMQGSGGGGTTTGGGGGTTTGGGGTMTGGSGGDTLTGSSSITPTSLVAVSDPALGPGVDLSYTVTGTLTQGDALYFYWSTTQALSGSFETADMPVATYGLITPQLASAGSHGPIFIPDFAFGKAPIGAEYLLVVTNPTGTQDTVALHRSIDLQTFFNLYLASDFVTATQPKGSKHDKITRDGPLTASQKAGLSEIIQFIEQDDSIDLASDVRFASYILATIKRETGNKYVPTIEIGSKDYFNKYEPGTKLGKSLGNTEKGDGFRYRGRGYVQITGRAQYEKLGTALNVGLVADPNLAVDSPQIAYEIISLGMREGLFTGKSFDQYINDNETDYYNARRVVNGLDRAGLIAVYAQNFQNILEGSYLP